MKNSESTTEDDLVIPTRTTRISDAQRRKLVMAAIRANPRAPRSFDLMKAILRGGS